METPKFTGKNPETHKRLLHMMMFIFISNLFQMLLFSYFKKSLFHGALFWGRPVYSIYLKWVTNLPYGTIEFRFINGKVNRSVSNI